MDRSYVPTNASLFELLNAMDRLDEDHDLLFAAAADKGHDRHLTRPA